MDAENMEFPEAYFDFVWSRGVINHSSDTRRALAEITRVLWPGRRFIAMVYHKLLEHPVRGGLCYGVLEGQFFRGYSLHEIIQDSTDGALARYDTIPQWHEALGPGLTVQSTKVFGSRSQLVPIPMGAIKAQLMKAIPARIGRMVTNRPFFGFMVTTDAIRQ
jgi:SAM-dependent methyltransferase